MTELVERLRTSKPYDSLDQEAADEIERLRAALTYTGTELGKAREDIERLTADLNESERQTRAQLSRVMKRDAEIERLQKQADAIGDELMLANAEIDKLEKRLEVYATDGTRLSESCDGIACRDETIRLQDKRIAKLEKVLEAVKNHDRFALRNAIAALEDDDE